MYNPPKIGIGITYFPEINEFIQENSDLIKVIEVEPQTHWSQLHTVPPKYRINFNLLQRIKKLPQKKVVHSVATPVGGPRSLDPSQFPYLQQTIDELGALWFSDHLSFNTAFLEEREFKTSFFLPPLQSYSGIKNCVKSINAISNKIKTPFAIENGANYLRSGEDEILDGDFVDSIIERADCGLILDLHNLWTNELNGRQSVKNFLKSVCKDRVWEIHLAGGTEEEGFYIDAHAGEIPKRLIDITKETINYFPNLSALIFEMTPSYLRKIDNDFKFIKEQLKCLHALWNSRNDNRKNNNFPTSNSTNNDIHFVGYNLSPNHWENILGFLVLGLKRTSNSEGEEELVKRLSDDPAVKLINKIIFEVRASNIVTTMVFSSKLLLVHLGTEGFNNLLKKFFKEFTPSLFANIEAKNFHEFLQAYRNIELLDETLSIDMCILRYNVEGTRQRLVLPKNPLILMKNLLNYQLPSYTEDSPFQLEIGEDGIHSNML